MRGRAGLRCTNHSRVHAPSEMKKALANQATWGSELKSETMRGVAVDRINCGHRTL